MAMQTRPRWVHRWLLADEDPDALRAENERLRAVADRMWRQLIADAALMTMRDRVVDWPGAIKSAEAAAREYEEIVS
jgi:hypothetical protein